MIHFLTASAPETAHSRTDHWRLAVFDRFPATHQILFGVILGIHSYLMLVQVVAFYCELECVTQRRRLGLYSVLT